MKKIENDEIMMESIEKLANPSTEELLQRVDELTKECQNYPETVAMDYALLELEFWRLTKAYHELQNNRVSA
ncbi:MAG: hypothetical protein IKN07_12885 [Lachnospiraceae bacterium]|nr:hypothetical protein [Lachnospiraceae bacterium]MBR3736768.1 hypothetical protein [Lachnospiraceae bacterium]